MWSNDPGVLGWLQMAWRQAIRTHHGHDDVIKWNHFPRYWPFVRGIHRNPVNSPHKGQWRGALMFSLICVWINDWVNNRQAGDLRRYRAHYDVTLMRTHHGDDREYVVKWMMINSIYHSHRINNVREMKDGRQPLGFFITTWPDDFTPLVAHFVWIKTPSLNNVFIGKCWQRRSFNTCC